VRATRGVSLDSELFSTVPPYFDSASTALSGVTFSTTMNSADVPGWSMSRTWSWNCLSTVFLVTLPISAPIPAPTAMPRKGTKNSMPNSIPQNMPQVAPAPTAWWLVTTRILPSLLRMIAATASAWMTSSCCRRSVSSIADSAVVSSGYPIAIRSAIPTSLPLLVRPSGPWEDEVQPHRPIEAGFAASGLTHTG
jgi:hypothetical protein